MKTLAIWDLDGTLTESRPWIEASYRHAAETMGLKPLEGRLLDSAMCGDLFSNVKRLYGLEGEKALEFARLYRSYYSENCFDRVELFAGIRRTLEEVRSRGADQAVATMKPEGPANDLLRRLEVADYFVKIAGTDFEGKRSKCQMIKECMACGEYDNVIMIGDCPSDRKAAEEAGVKFVAAAFGYGYPVDKCIKEGIEYIESPIDVIRYL